MFERIGPLELIIIAVLVMMIFGVGKLPQVGKSMGHGLREFREAVSGREGRQERAETARSAPEATEETTPDREDKAAPATRLPPTP